jgi:hypothetical protein
MYLRNVSVVFEVAVVSISEQLLSVTMPRE